MEKFDILRELPKRDPETQSQQMLLEKGADRLAWRGAATDPPCVPSAVSARV